MGDLLSIVNMSIDVKEFERRALELMKQADFGPEAVRVNAQIVEHDPTRQAAWTRLGRCHLEQRNFDEAVTALRAALTLNPANSIATNLLAEARRRRALTPTATTRGTTGFSIREFTMLETLSPDEAARALQPRFSALFDTINATAIAARIVESRHRQGESGSSLFHANSLQAPFTGHIFAFHHGGRWEPQFNLGWYGTPPHATRAFRVGLGFNLSHAGRDPDRADPDRAAGQERILVFYDRFQRTIEKSWKRELAQWMGENTGFIQYSDHPPAVDLLPERAVEWLLNCRDAAALEWVFLGRWLFLDNPQAAIIVADRAKLARFVDETFRSLYPLWQGTYAG
jgi:tetratricopeptide (TPR) repeat protein